jgi:hypothetical protein
MRSGRHEPMHLERLQRSLSRLSRPAARPEFRDRLRRQFVRGPVPERASAWGSMPHLSPLSLAALTATTAALMLFLGWQLNAGPTWKITAISGHEIVRVDGRPVASDSPAKVARALKPGSRVWLPEGTQLDLELPGVAVIQIVGGSSARLPGSPGRWLGRSMKASIETGEIRISTGPAFQGIRFDVRTPEVRAVVTGTTLAVLRQRDASCVCVLEGEVAMLGGTDDGTVHAGYRRSVYRDGSAALLEPIRPMEAMKLTMLRDQASQALTR